MSTEFYLAVIESPYAGDIEANLAYLRECMAYAFRQGLAPFASHGLYTQPGVLNDEDPSERRLGIDAGFAWGARADERWFFVDRGVSRWMLEGWREAERLEQPRLVVALNETGGVWQRGMDALISGETYEAEP